MGFARNTAPTGWLACQGQAISRATYAALFAAIGTTFGAGDGTTTFNLPNLRGQFLRGWNDTASGLDASRAFGSTQASQNLAHNHGAATGSAGSHIHTGTTDSQGVHSHNGATDAAGSHAHSGTTSTDSHNHWLAYGDGGSAYNYGLNAEGADNDATTQTLDGRVNTSTDSHSHTLNVNAAGSHAHNFNTNAAGAHSHNLNIASAGGHTHSVTVQNEGGSEARPNNIALLYCIKT